MAFMNMLKWSAPLLLTGEVVATTLVPIRPSGGRHNKREEPSGFDLKGEETFLWGAPGILTTAGTFTS